MLALEDGTGAEKADTGDDALNDPAHGIVIRAFDLQQHDEDTGPQAHQHVRTHTRRLALCLLVALLPPLAASADCTGQNLLDASKDEVFDKFGTLSDQAARSYDEYELETEEAGPSYQVVMRWAF